MPFASAIQRTCACGVTFLTKNYNQSRCPVCQSAHSRDRRRAARAARNDIAWINMYIDGLGDALRCPMCYKRMADCRCEDKSLKPFKPPAVATWRPEKIRLEPFKCHDVAMWQPWK